MQNVKYVRRKWLEKENFKADFPPEREPICVGAVLRTGNKLAFLRVVFDESECYFLDIVSILTQSSLRVPVLITRLILKVCE